MVLELKSGDDIIETLNTIRKDSNLIVVFEDFGGYTTKPFDCDSHTNFFNKNSLVFNFYVGVDGFEPPTLCL